jgi:hypothetical protein
LAKKDHAVEFGPWHVTTEGAFLPLGNVLREIGRINCLRCGGGGLEQRELDHTVVDPLQSVTDLN